MRIWNPEFDVIIFRSESEFETETFMSELLAQDQDLKSSFRSESQFENQIFIWELLAQDHNMKPRFLSQNF